MAKNITCFASLPTKPSDPDNLKFDINDPFFSLAKLFSIDKSPSLTSYLNYKGENSGIADLSDLRRDCQIIEITHKVVKALERDIPDFRVSVKSKSCKVDHPREESGFYVLFDADHLAKKIRLNLRF